MPIGTSITLLDLFKRMQAPTDQKSSSLPSQMHQSAPEEDVSSAKQAAQGAFHVSTKMLPKPGGLDQRILAPMSELHCA